jgi:quinol monooxygenase YgiN
MNMGKILSVARFRIRPGKLPEFQQIAAECLQIVREKDTGTTMYEWFMNEDQTECIAIDCYESSEAVIEHAKNVGPTMRRLRDVADLSAEILGSPSEQLVKALQFKSEGIFARLQGLD